MEIAEHMGMNIKTERKKDDLWGTIEFAFEKCGSWILHHLNGLMCGIL